MQLIPFVRRLLPPAALDVRPLDIGRWQFWQGIRHLFPAHANAVQTGSGSIAISWSMEHDPHATQETAAPIVIRASEELFEILELAPLNGDELLEECVEEVKQGLTGYDPYAAFPQVRVITVGAQG